MQCSMMPLILHTANRTETDTYIDQYANDHSIGRHFIARMEPAGKEFSIKQIRELIKETVYAHNEPYLFVLYDFDTASIEAQNAFLKTLEEHQSTNMFIMEVRQPSRLLPTILSRSRIVKQGTIQEYTSAADIKKLFSAAHPPLNHPTLQASQYEHPTDAIDAIINAFRADLATDPKRSAPVLKEALVARTRILANNITAQYALDRLVIFIYKLYTS